MINAKRRKSGTYYMTDVSWRWWAIRILALAGVGVAGYLAFSHMMNQEIACGQSAGCGIVDDSKYAEIIVANIPISLLGLLSYIAILVFTLLRGTLPDKWDVYTLLVVYGISLSGMLFSIYLTYMELFVILGVCKWCVASACLMCAIFILSVFELRKLVFS
jgi:uncharacterized membrane protein